MCKYKAILVTLILSVVLVSSEFISELGVNPRKDCGPKKLYGEVISDFRISSVSDAEVAASGLALSRLNFTDKNSFSFLPKRFPRNVNEQTCISCYTLNDTNFILKNCSVSDRQVFSKGQFSVRINGTSTAFGTVSTQFIDTTNNEVFEGAGDLTRNLYNCGLFIFQPTLVRTKLPTTTYRVRYFEYIQSKTKCQEIIDEAKDSSIVRVTENEVSSYLIQCDANSELDSEWFQKSLRAYWAMKLENTMDNIPVIEGKFPKITVEEVYRSVLSAKVIDNAESGLDGYYEFFECGSYDVLYIVPFVSSVTLVVILAISSVFLTRKENKFIVPNSSKSWYREVHGRGNAGSSLSLQDIPSRSYFSLVTDEFVLNGESVFIEVGHGRQRSTSTTSSVFDVDGLPRTSVNSTSTS